MRLLFATALLAVLAGCASSSVSPGFHRVESGETLSAIARRYNQSVPDLVRWNKLNSANRIEKGQLLRVQPPGGTSGTVASKPRSSAASPPPSAPRGAPVTGITLIWPAEGKLTRTYNGTSSNGLTIANASGTPVLAAAAGTVAYASHGLRGYGNLVILRHGNNFITIYAHNRKLLVKQGQSVKQGQQIAEMGNSDASSNQLYFELRRDGKPVNPTGVLPRR
ncbi:LysM peptidoglycan-binding domain-containing M23 family metallopeptidase [Bordetella avium]|uniref:LysM peptidoglycan-binding domain-containing M23 family metallopeptidase n=1 Tax=Bordetella avium TaxID=521 RepID=UPI00057A391D|nr:LysM peptidoglycan-binding domain-containing M23 family metallopeptidase [Bordetella avium]AZY50802.1 LysM peptidoglycan-binding domain-containing protein [Bordetella avium]AZY54188.1 LysM peptidoglycan-binding domain-containing protein [Bordetella avium]RIQ13580.1 LysM peptidoglycan-binding domain-containing protein [Bordetella avium]RIQ16647.1 LysM peptidoglycan-binding domain-containing protein [Bordetella avium]RIQ31409.1 LysM peptidoglycan-binding domain-containing protein [Bordetella 